MTKFGIITAYSAAILATAGLTGAQAGMTNGFTQLTEAELKVLLPGIRISFVSQRADGANSESFGCNGEWGTLDGRFQRSGRYSIRDNAYCLETQRGIPTYCSRVFRNAAGALFVQAVLPPPAVTPMREIRIDRAAAGPGCSR